MKKFMFYKLIQGDLKVMKQITDTYSIFQKINYNKIRKQKKTMLYFLLEMSTAFSDACFSSRLMQSGEEFLCHGNGSPDEILSICSAQENREMFP
jgi:hypothetical protein